MTVGRNVTPAGGADVDTELDGMGPVDYLVVEFPEGRLNAKAFPLLIDLVDRGLIRILDLAFIKKEQDGSVLELAIAELDDDTRRDLAVFDGASSGLLGQDDFDTSGAALTPGSSGAILVYENAWAAPFATAMRHAGAQLVSIGRIPVQGILAALDQAEARR